MTVVEGPSFPCPCCAFLTIDEPGGWEICVVCFWEDDPVQSDDEHCRGGANRMSLREAKENFREFGISKPNHIAHIRPPNLDEVTDGDAAARRETIESVKSRQQKTLEKFRRRLP